MEIELYDKLTFKLLKNHRYQTNLITTIYHILLFWLADYFFFIPSLT
jgi:hypothetical protein